MFPRERRRRGAAGIPGLARPSRIFLGQEKLRWKNIIECSIIWQIDRFDRLLRCFDYTEHCYLLGSDRSCSLQLACSELFSTHCYKSCSQIIFNLEQTDRTNKQRNNTAGKMIIYLGSSCLFHDVSKEMYKCCNDPCWSTNKQLKWEAALNWENKWLIKIHISLTNIIFSCCSIILYQSLGKGSGSLQKLLIYALGFFFGAQWPKNHEFQQFWKLFLHHETL